MKDKAASGGGVFDLLIHDVDMALLLCGKPDAVSATGAEDLAAGIDTIAATLHGASVPSVSIAGGWHPGPFPFSMEYTVVCAGGVIDYHSGFGDPKVYKAGAAEPELLASPEGVDGYAEEIRYFAGACLGQNDLAWCRPEESALAVRVALAMSAARGYQGEKAQC
jgi:predicted dehydrogenase